MPKIFILAAEPSADLHGSRLVSALKRKSPAIEIVGWGGQKMASAGAKILKPLDELAFMGFFEIVRNLPQILKNFRDFEAHIRSEKPDLVLLMDYPGFNLRAAKMLNKMGIKPYYYISPQVWAWKENRVRTIRRFIEKIFVILPFEEAYFKQHGINAEYVGHPLMEVMNDLSRDADFLARNNLSEEQTIVAVLPGSRAQEVRRIMPEICRLGKTMRGVTLVVSKVAWLDSSLYGNCEGIRLLDDDTYQLLMHSRAAIVTSGTATLETALLGIPEVVVYRANAVSIFLAKKLVKIKYISLVNLIAGKMVVPELIQSKANSNEIYEAVTPLITDGPERDRMISEFENLRALLGNKCASENVANALLKTLASAKS
ncbi:MAG: lipid-A-disaccharide synthase [Salibacteraceae bacterium]